MLRVVFRNGIMRKLMREGKEPRDQGFTRLAHQDSLIMPSKVIPPGRKGQTLDLECTEAAHKFR
jgi:hypothetical protein